MPDGNYWVSGEVDDLTNPKAERAAMTGQPQVTVAADTTVTLDGASAVPVSASVTGHPTTTAAASVHAERGFAGQTWAADMYFFGPPTSAPVLYAQPTGTASTGTFRGSTRTDYLSTGSGIAWNEEISPPFTLDGASALGEWVIEVPAFEQYEPGSRQTADWAKQPFRQVPTQPPCSR